MGWHDTTYRQVGPSTNAFDLYSGGNQFESKPVHRFYWLASNNYFAMFLCIFLISPTKPRQVSSKWLLYQYIYASPNNSTASLNKLLINEWINNRILLCDSSFPSSLRLFLRSVLFRCPSWRKTYLLVWRLCLWCRLPVILYQCINSCIEILCHFKTYEVHFSRSRADKMAKNNFHQTQKNATVSNIILP